MSVPSFNEWLQQEGHAPNGRWVLSRRTPMMLARYPDATFFTSKRLGELEEEHRKLVRDEAIDAYIMGLDTRDGGPPLRDMLVAVFEMGRERRFR